MPTQSWRKKNPGRSLAAQRRWQKANIEKVRAQARARYAANPKRACMWTKRWKDARGKEAQREYWLRHTFGMTLAEYAEKLTQQNGVCAICHQPETRMRKGQPLPLVVDHNHDTGQVRALLCHKCNISLGFLDENPDRMRAMALYVEQFYTRTRPE